MAPLWRLEWLSRFPHFDGRIPAQPDELPIEGQHGLAPGGGTFVAALMRGDAFDAALEAATAKTPEFDLTATLGVLLAGAAIHRLDEDTTQ